MSLAARTVLVVLVAVLSVAFVWAVSQIRPVADVKMTPEPPPDQSHPAGIKGLAIGTAGCLAAACHGAPAHDALAGKFDDGTWQSSGSCWVAADPHASAYSLLTDRPYHPVKVTAEEIMAKYAPGKKATEDARCLACHTNPTLAEPGPTTDARVLSLRAEGVGCEACHGNAGGWLRQHTTWKGDRTQVYHDSGMVRLYDLSERATACVGCHIGSPALGKPDEGGLAVRDMNHDMIAAGHPRLNFDYAEYLRRLPVHWQEKDRTAKGNIPRGSGFAARAWLVGRLAHAEAACRLLDDRAARARKDDPRTPWPEFAEFNCASCHHDLPAEWRAQALAGRTPGAPPWQMVWPVTPAIGLNPQRPVAIFANSKDNPEQALRALLDAIEKPRFVGPGRVQPHALKAADALARFRGELNGLSEAEAIKKAEVVLAGSKADKPDWDSGLQTLFGLAALDRTRPRDAVRDGLFRDAFNAYRATGVDEKLRWPKVVDAIQKLNPK